MPSVTVWFNWNGIADRQDPFGDPELRRVPPRQHRQPARLDLQERQVGPLVDADDLRLELALVRHHDRHLRAGVADDVVVGEDVAVVRDDDAGAEALRDAVARRRHLGSPKK